MIQQVETSEKKAAEDKAKSQENKKEKAIEKKHQNTEIAEDAYSRKTAPRGRGGSTFQRGRGRGTGARGQYQGQRGARYNSRGGYNNYNKNSDREQQNETEELKEGEPVENREEHGYGSRGTLRGRGRGRGYRGSTTNFRGRGGFDGFKRVPLDLRKPRSQEREQFDEDAVSNASSDAISLTEEQVELMKEKVK